jgi:hypothetical protein
MSEATETTGQFTVWPCDHGGVQVEFGLASPGHRCAECGAEPIRVVALTDVALALEEAYHPQNPLSMHPADFVTKRYQMPGHEGLEER